MKATIQNTEILFDNIVNRAITDWTNGNRGTVADQLANADPIAAAYFAAAVIDSLENPVDRKILRSLLRNKAIAAYGPCTNTEV